MEEDIEVCQIPSLPDQVLADLGVRTVGARLRLRSAASQWVPNQVISFLSLEISFVQIFFQPSGPEDVEQGEPDQPDHHVDGEGGEGGEGGDVGDDVEAAAGLHFFSLTKSTSLLSCCNLLFYSKPGRITHHFSHGAYRMDRVSVKPNGRAYFSCSVKSCRAR